MEDLNKNGLDIEAQEQNQELEPETTEITMSYRISEGHIWKPIIDNVAKTLSF